METTTVRRVAFVAARTAAAQRGLAELCKFDPEHHLDERVLHEQSLE
jgi:hypothetical protein